jgi:hypothetical protein
VGIGAIKSGTTWLWQCLRVHAQIFMPVMKELEFFDSRFDRGFDWYRSFFAEAGSRICGEISPQYMHCPAAVERMAPLRDSARLLVCLRNPVERAYSHYMMDARAEPGMAPRDKVLEFDRLAREGSSKYVRFGCYAEQLAPYLSAWTLSRIHVVLFDDIVQRPSDVVAQVCRFLGVDDRHQPEELHERVNASKRYRSVRLFNAMRLGVRLVERIGLAEAVMYLKKSAVRDRVLALLETEQAYDQMSPSARAQLTEFYAPANERLARLIERDLSLWSRP